MLSLWFWQKAAFPQPHPIMSPQTHLYAQHLHWGILESLFIEFLKNAERQVSHPLYMCLDYLSSFLMPRQP